MYHFEQYAHQGDQYVPDMKFLPNIKLEPDLESYYPMTIDLMNTTKFVSKQSICTTTSTRQCDTSRLMIQQSAPPTPPTTTATNYTKASQTTQNAHAPTPDGEPSLRSFCNNLNNNTNNNTMQEVQQPQKITKGSRSRKSRRSTSCGKTTRRRRGSSVRTSTSLDSTTGLPKEKDRARQFNEAFEGLRKRIPSIPASKKLSKIEILRLAICYMSYLRFAASEEHSISTITNDGEQQDGISSSRSFPAASTIPGNYLIGFFFFLISRRVFFYRKAIYLLSCGIAKLFRRTLCQSCISYISLNHIKLRSRSPTYILQFISETRK